MKIMELFQFGASVLICFKILLSPQDNKTLVIFFFDVQGIALALEAMYDLPVLLIRLL